MTSESRPRILIIGAGSMGIVTGYHLELAGAEVTFLVRPHRREMMDRPQMLYCYDDNSLKQYTGYTYITEPTKILEANYDYIVITLDGVSLRNEIGQSLVETIGVAARGKNTRVILGTVFVDLRSWFLQASGLSAEQVTNGYLGIQAYPTKSVTLPIDAPTDPSLVAQADVGYIHCFDYGFCVDDSSPAVAEGFAEIYNANGVSRCMIKPALQYAAELHPLFAVFAASELMDWPKFQDIAKNAELWSLAVAAVKEIQGLSIHGVPGQEAARDTTGSGLAASLAEWEQRTLPLELQAFNRFHHGGKVNAQDRALLRACLAQGEVDGKPMSALKALLTRVEERVAA